MKAVMLTEEMINGVITTTYGEGAVLTFLEEMEMDAVVVYDGEKIKRIIDIEDVLFDLGQAFNQTFVSFEIVELGTYGVGYVFHVPTPSKPKKMASCA